MRSGNAGDDAVVFSSQISPSRPAASQRPQRPQESHPLTRISFPRDLLLRRICKLWQTVAFDDLQGARAKSTIVLAMVVGVVMDTVADITNGLTRIWTRMTSGVQMQTFGKLVRSTVMACPMKSPYVA